MQAVRTEGTDTYHRLFQIYDKKAGLYHIPTIAMNNVEAVRQLTESVTNEKSRIAKNPEDYDLYETGLFNAKTGKVHNHEQFEFITNAYAVMIQEMRRIQNMKGQIDGTVQIPGRKGESEQV